MNKRTIFYATRSPFKQEELEIIANDTFEKGGASYRIGDLVDFRVSAIETKR